MSTALADHFTRAIDALLAISDAYLLAGRLDDALRVLAQAEQLSQMPDARPRTKREFSS